MEIRLKKNPSFTIIDGTAGVGTFNNKKWFVCCLQPSNNDGKLYPGYYAFWRYKKEYDSKDDAILACRNWLNMSLI